jgi:hypothetical protein
MKQAVRVFAATAFALSALSLQAAELSVTTTNNPGAGSLFQALTSAQDEDTITFNIPGAGPHYIATPTDGYPYIRANNLTINGYSQPGAVPNTNPILSSNNAQIKIVLDSRNGNTKLMDFPGDTTNDDTGYGDTESAILGILGATNVTVSGLCLIGPEVTGTDGAVSVYGISFAKGANGHVQGCWIGVDVTGNTGYGYGPADAITGFRYQGRDENNTTTNTILIRGVTVGVGKSSTTPRAEFNVITSVPSIPIQIEGDDTRIAGNFINVLPSGLRDYNPAFDDAAVAAADANSDLAFQGDIEIGRGGNNTVIGTDGDGVNDADERNIFSGAVPPSLHGYDHNIEFYGQTPGTNIVVAGNYFGVGVDGTTRFTNGVPALNAAGGSAQFRFGSDLDGVSDNLEGNVVYNNWPNSLFPASDWDPSTGTIAANTLNFFDELSTGASLSARGNVLVDNFPFPVSPLKSDGGVDGAFLTNYLAKALADPNNGATPVLATNSSTSRLAGTVPPPSTDYPVVMLDLYTVDQEGLTNGMAANIPELPSGFVQGKTYLASYTVTSTNGTFDLDISGLSLAAATQVTATANYSAAPAGTHNAIVITSAFASPVTLAAGAAGAPNVTASRSGQNLVIAWPSSATGYLLQSSDTLSPANWANVTPQPPIVPVGNQNTVTVPIAPGNKFYRLSK